MKLLPLAPKILRLIRYILSQFLTPFAKSCMGPLSQVGGAVVRLDHSLARLKICGAAPPRGRNMFFQKIRFRWVRFNIEIAKVTGPNFTGLVSPNAGGIAVDGMSIRF